MFFENLSSQNVKISAAMILSEQNFITFLDKSQGQLKQEGWIRHLNSFGETRESEVWFIRLYIYMCEKINSTLIYSLRY
jgi:hypothetical protein